jgi:hypothetical protein
MINEHIITFDVDWAPDFAIELVANELSKRKIKSTWFVTHASPAIEKLKMNELVELGIHPNFLPNSTHGNTTNEIIKKMLEIVPNAKCIRTHGLYNSTYLYREIARNETLEIDSSILMPEIPDLKPHTIHYEEFGSPLSRVPIFWEDDIEMYNPHKKWQFKNKKYHVNGMKIFNFHPLHVFLNSNNMKIWKLLKEISNLDKIEFNIANQHINKNSIGVKNFFEEMCDHISNEQGFSSTISEIVKKK